MSETRHRQKRNLTLTADADALLEQVGERNASEYLSRVIEQRWREWTEAVAVLQSYGLRRPEVLACADVLNGAIEMLQARPPAWLAIELEDAVGDGICEKWDVPRDRWAKLCQEAACSHELAWAIRIAAREIWTDNAACEKAVERLGRKRG